MIAKLIAIALVVLASGCTTEVPEDALDDPMAHPTIAFAEEIERGQDDGSGSLLMSEPATLWTFYRVENEHLQDAFDDLLNQASAGGWVLAPATFSGPPADSGRFRYDGTKEGTSVRLRIDVNNDREMPDTHHAIVVNLVRGAA